MLKPDLVFTRDDKPLVVVEVKDTPTPPRFHRAALERIAQLLEQTGSQWALLVDPATTQIFGKQDPYSAMAILSTEEILEAAGLWKPRVWGELFLLVAVRRWLEMLPDSAQFLALHPNIQGLADAARQADGSSLPATA